jgi:hypothetical protein|tara:strand:- start:4794 stop:5066 length:273 start_codon:yes stop_codon:yes gene_type:complete
MFTPVNRYVLVDIPPPSSLPPESLIMLPEDYKPEQERYAQVRMLAAASDTRFSIPENSKLIVDRSMIEEISIGGTIYNVILDNYIVGIIT